MQLAISLATVWYCLALIRVVESYPKEARLLDRGTVELNASSTAAIGNLTGENGIEASGEFKAYTYQTDELLSTITVPEALGFIGQTLARLRFKVDRNDVPEQWHYTWQSHRFVVSKLMPDMDLQWYHIKRAALAMQTLYRAEIERGGEGPLYLLGVSIVDSNILDDRDVVAMVEMVALDRRGSDPGGSEDANGVHESDKGNATTSAITQF